MNSGFEVAYTWVILELNHVTSLRREPFPLIDFITGAMKHAQVLRVHILAWAPGQRMGALEHRSRKSQRK